MEAGSGKNLYGPLTATMLVVANMVGTGVFTSLGFQVTDLHSGFSILILWLAGGIASLCGALCYAELGALFKKSGGEYRFLSSLYHPLLGFLAGWVSFMIGFAAPVAAAAIALGQYLTHALHVQDSFSIADHYISIATLCGAAIVLPVTLAHSFSHSFSARFQNTATIIKIVVISGLAGVGLFSVGQGDTSFVADSAAWGELVSPFFVVSLYFVSYAYSGWNASAYIAGEVRNPARTIPLSLALGTLIVAVLYIGLNAAFLKAIPQAEMSGQLDVGLIYARISWGSLWGDIMGGIIAGLLISSISSMVIAGPRVTLQMGQEYPALSFFSRVNKNGIPVRALWLQLLITWIYLATASFSQVIVYIGFTLNLFTFLCVLGLMIHRHRHPEAERPFRTPLYPVVPIIFLLFSSWVMIFGIIYQPVAAMAGIGVTLSGALVYYIALRA